MNSAVNNRPEFGSLMKSVAELSRSTLRSFGPALEGATGKFNPDRTRVPIPERSFGGTIGQTVVESVGDWTTVPGTNVPETVQEIIFDLKPVHLEAEKPLHEHASVQAVGQGAAREQA